MSKKVFLTRWNGLMLEKAREFQSIVKSYADLTSSNIFLTQPLRCPKYFWQQTFGRKCISKMQNLIFYFFKGRSLGNKVPSKKFNIINQNELFFVWYRKHFGLLLRDDNCIWLSYKCTFNTLWGVRLSPLYYLGIVKVIWKGKPLSSRLYFIGRSSSQLFFVP